MSRLLMIVPAPVNRLADGRLRLDVKFVEGMRLHAKLWPGPLSVVMWDHGQSIPFGAEYDRDDLGFEAQILDKGAPLTAALLSRFDRIAASADMVETLELAGPGKPPVIYAIEYTIGTRLKIVALDRQMSWPRKIWSMIWNMRMEAIRRQAFRLAAGLEANGYPAYEAYRGLNASTMMYLDGRMRSEMMATPAEMVAKSRRAAFAEPLRIVHSGRLEPMKGAMDLIPVASRLMSEGIAFSLDIFGDGSLKAEIAKALPEFQGRVRLHDPVDFETVLVPWMRANADLFLSCHRQSDPSCTYLESMGCGVPVIGYDNAMWKAMQADSGAGWVVPMGQTARMAEKIAELSERRDELTRMAERGLEFARYHDFETEFNRRTLHQVERRWKARS
ncbi:glycosyltransferase family 4 protein [Thioclava sp. FR2]|uniref:glycosyltransferase family 4 protein n=1 Tax=Thioclava sp. FR2 TaxID=3445780 RepID=UPI003EBCA589